MKQHIIKHLKPRVSKERWQMLHRWRRPAFFGTLGRVTPLSDVWGSDRGAAIDRFYIASFLAEHKSDIRGRTLEIGADRYTKEYGQAIESRDILDIDASNPAATIIADLASADHVPGNQFDCFVLTQTLQLIYDVKSAVRHAHRLLKPGGVLLVTVPMISRIIPDIGLECDYWRFTSASCARLFGDEFGPERTLVRTYGNALSGIAFLAGASREEIDVRKLQKHDDYFPLIVAVRAVKRAE